MKDWKIMLIIIIVFGSYMTLIILTAITPTAEDKYCEEQGYEGEYLRMENYTIEEGYVECYNYTKIENDHRIYSNLTRNIIIMEEPIK